MVVPGVVVVLAASVGDEPLLAVEPPELELDEPLWANVGSATAPALMAAATAAVARVRRIGVAGIWPPGSGDCPDPGWGTRLRGT